ncbi:MBL fold metallo-hydrolase [Pedobacter panaciterrae]|uniref:MBL fold metallo-hydrolase n=1 Tax=Pedobacter panaciterrae TaxID=363849 RepID=A0ABU8NJV1_9SPHI
MIIEQIYTGCLAQGAYYIQSGNEAAIIDPLREVLPYLEKSASNQAVIKYVFETHFHADFVSGHVDLSNQSGATIIYGPNANPSFSAHIAKDGEVFKLGEISIKVLHTPGHTMESTCYLLIDAQGKETALFSGDTLFIGDVGRPDLAQKAAHITQEELAGMLFTSLREKVMKLDDSVIIYPAHGAGSACGKNMSKETTDTLRHQKLTNYALRADVSREEFINEVTQGLTAPPAYFPMNVKMNREGYDSFATVLDRGTHALTPDAFEMLAKETGALMLDTREAQIFAKAFIPGSINIGINGNFAPWVGALVPDIQQPILVIADHGREKEVITRLSRVGYDHAIGFLDGGIDAWIANGKETDEIVSITAEELADRLGKSNSVNILDVRNASEYFSEHLKEARNAPLDYINNNMADLDKGETYYIHCAGGYRSMMFNSILRARGFNHLIDIKGGFKAITESHKFKTSESVCPGKMNNQ